MRVFVIIHVGFRSQTLCCYKAGLQWAHFSAWLFQIYYRNSAAISKIVVEGNYFCMLNIYHTIIAANLWIPMILKPHGKVTVSIIKYLAIYPPKVRRLFFLKILEHSLQFLHKYFRNFLSLQQYFDLFCNFFCSKWCEWECVWKGRQRGRGLERESAHC